MSNVKYDLNPDILYIVVETTDDGDEIVSYNMKPSLFATLPAEKKIAIMINKETGSESAKIAEVYFYENVWTIYSTFTVNSNMTDDVWELEE